MLKRTLLHPEINRVLARAGHHAKILVADGNYPASTAIGPNAELVSLALSPGIPTVDQVLAALLADVPIDAAHTMDYERTGKYALKSDPAAWASFRDVIRRAKAPLKVDPVEKWAFYEAVRTPDHVLTIQTADSRPFANLLLVMGVRT